MKSLSVILSLSIIVALLALPAFGAAAPVNATSCLATTICTTTWSVTSGNVLAVATIGANGSTTVSDAQANSYTTLQGDSQSPASVYLRATVLSAGGSTLMVTLGAAVDRVIIAEFSGVTLTTDGGFTEHGSNSYLCPYSPFSLTTTTSDLILSVWHNYAGAQSSCTASSGSLAGTEVCGGANTSEMRYQIGGAATYTQQFAFYPTYNTGNTVCVIQALKAAASSPGVKRRMLQ